MPTFEIKSPDGQTFHVNAPEGATEQDAIGYVQKNFYQGSTDRYSTTDPASKSWLEKKRDGLATAPINAYLGIKQMFGGLSPTEQSVLAQNKQAEKDAPVTSFGSNVLTAIPAMFVPGANTVVGAGLVGGGLGLAQPVQGDQSLSNILSGKLMNTSVGMLTGMGSQAAGNKISDFLKQRLSAAQAAAAANASRNSVRDTTLQAGREAGYVVPNSEVAPSFLGDIAESFGGKAAVKQEMTQQNQQTTNALARKAIGLPEDAPLSAASIDPLKREAWKAYQDIAALPVTKSEPAIIGSIVDEGGKPLINTPAKVGFNPKQALEDLKQLRFDAKAQFNFYNRSLNPEALTKAKELQAAADALETKFEDYAAGLGKPGLVDALQQARVQLAKIGTVERALNDANGDVSARVLGRLADKGAPLTNELKTIGQFNNAFPKFMGEGAKSPASGVSYTNLLSSPLLGLLGHSTLGPGGALLAGAPFARGGMRSLLMTQAMQKTPQYTVPMLTKAGGQITPEMLSTLSRAAMLSAQ